MILSKLSPWTLGLALGILCQGFPAISEDSKLVTDVKVHLQSIFEFLSPADRLSVSNTHRFAASDIRLANHLDEAIFIERRDTRPMALILKSHAGSSKLKTISIEFQRRVSEDDLRMICATFPNLEGLFFNAVLPQRIYHNGAYGVPATKLTTQMVRLLKNLPKLKRLSLSGTQMKLNESAERVSAITWTPLKALTDLVELNLAGHSNLKDAGMGFLAALPSLKVLNIYGSSCTGEFLNALHPNARLTTLDVSYCRRLEPAFFNLLAKQTELTTLDLSDTQPSDAALIAVSKVTQLRHLKLRHAYPLTSAVIASMESFNNLESLDLSNSSTLSNSILEAIAKAVPNLDSLFLNRVGGFQVGNAVPNPLAGFTRLRRLGLDGRFGGASFVSLASWADLTTLEHLSLLNYPINDAVLTAISNNLNLKSLALSSRTVTDQMMASLLGLQQLNSLSVPETCLSSHGLASIAHLKNLVSLEGLGSHVGYQRAPGIQLSSAKLELLTQLPLLQQVKLLGDVMSREEADAFTELHATRNPRDRDLPRNPVKVLLDDYTTARDLSRMDEPPDAPGILRW